MKVTKLAFAMTLTGLMCAGHALAQVGQAPAESVQRTSFAYDSYYANDEDAVASPSDATSSNGCDAAAGSCGCAGGCSSCCDCKVPGVGDCPCGTELDCGEPWTLQQCGNCWGITYGGWLSAGVTVNDQGNTSQVANSQLGFRNDPHINLDQAWVYFERGVDTGGCGWDWGFRFDIMAGVDGPDTQAFSGFGWDSDWQWGNGQYGAAMPQAYLEFGYNDLTVKAGHFFTIIGYEVVPAPDNFFYSHSYTQYYAEPFTHTGVLADYALTDQISIQAGWTNGWDQGFNTSNDASTFLGGVSWTSASDNVSVAYAVNTGDWGNGNSPGGVNVGDVYMHSIVASVDFGQGWTYVLQSDYANNSLPGQDTEWYGVNQYLLKEINCCWAAGLRFEWFRDDDGVRVDRAGLGGAQANYFELTAGVNWKPTANFRLRPEVRWDWKNGAGSGPRFDPVAGAYRSNSLFTFGIDGILTF